MLHLHRLLFSYPERKFCLSLDLPVGARLAVCGVSGIGKTTLLHLVAGLLTPTAGDLIWQNRSLLFQKAEERPIAYLLQSHHIFDHLTVEENIKLGLYSLPLKQRPNCWRRLHPLIGECGLDPFLKQKATLLSGGQKQRVALIRLLAQSQPIWLLDEPFNGLDTLTKGVILHHLLRWQQEIGATLLFTTHHADEVSAFATHRCHLVQYNDCVQIQS
jgi:ABC-type thiamine transport system ATPase subunit